MKPSSREVAAGWVLRREEGLDAAEQADLDAWLARDPRHPSWLEEAAAVRRFLQRSGSSPAGAGMVERLRVRAAARARRRRSAVMAAGLCAAAFAFGFFHRDALVPSRIPIPTTVVAQPDRQVLPDGSVVELGAGADFAYEFDEYERRIELKSGEALFTVTKDPARPFVVRTAALIVRAVGTEFAVHHLAGAVEVVVTEGRVALGTPASAGEVAVMDAGHRAVTVSGAEQGEEVEVRTITPEEIGGVLGWRRQRVVLSGTPLAEAVELLNRQNRVQLSVGARELAALRVSGVIWQNDAEAFARLIERSFPVQAERTAEDRIVFRAAR